MTAGSPKGNPEQVGARPGARGPGIVNISDARRPAGGRGQLSPEALYKELEEARELLDLGLPSAAESHLLHVTNNARREPRLLAHARHSLSIAYETLSRFRDSIEAVRPYEAREACDPLDPETRTLLRAQLGIAYNYSGDAPKAIALLNAELRELGENGTDAQFGAVYVALARVYRLINEFSIARDYGQKALDHHRRTGDWRGLAEAYFAVAMADIHEGSYAEGITNFEQVLKIVGDMPAAFLLGRVHGNIAAAYWHLRRPLDGIRALEKAIHHYERTEHKANAVLGYNNLGNNLMAVGQWERAHSAMLRALELAQELDVATHHTSMVYDSLGELYMARGELEEAREALEHANRLAVENGNKWYVAQVMRTLARCYLQLGHSESARATAEGALALAESVGDRQAVCEASLVLAEVSLEEGDADGCAALLQKVSDETAGSDADIGIAGEAQRVQGLLALRQGDHALAAHHFSRAHSIFEMLGDRHRTARALYWTGRAQAETQPGRAAENLSLAAHSFRELGARLDLKQTEEQLARLEGGRGQAPQEPSAPAQLLTLRLAEAVASRELLLRELAAVVHQETGARRVLIAEASEGGRVRAVVEHGCGEAECARLVAELEGARDEGESESLSEREDADVIRLRPANAPPATLFVSPRGQVAKGGVAVEPLLRVVELGMDVCALRTRTRAGKDQQTENSLTGASLMPGFIHSSPAMTRLVDEVHKIRSSDVTVLITGESGTGKELVARAIHALSSRRNKVFVPFNCTAVPKELSEGYLFGYRRGAFTGAVSDSPGVIRTAAGGTLFLDEIGDLPLDVQPKLLRFLQEGEIQPLGEQRPTQVDVRIIAATNTDLERMVEEGRFREDLYYRLNVIRLKVPPLRERRSEIPTIVNYYVNHYSAKFGRRDVTVTPQTIDLLMVCNWPGNVRELCNEIQRIVARADDGMVITPDHLSQDLRRFSPTTPVSPFGLAAGSGFLLDSVPSGTTLAEATAELERRMISEVMRKHNGNISRAARELGLTRRGLYLKLERLELRASA